MNEALQFWDKARISIQKLLQKLPEKWAKFKQNAKMLTKVKGFVDDLDNLFDKADERFQPE